MSSTLPHNHGNINEIEAIQKQTGHIDNFQTAADIFRYLGDTTRLRIFWLLCHCEECLINISALLNMSSPAVSHHLRPLKNNGFITSRRVGKEVYYRAANTEISRLLHQMTEKIMEISCPDSHDVSFHKAAHTISYLSEQEEIIHQVHDYLMENIDQHITIDELSRKFLINPTSLKTLFKSVYGSSLALHIKEHRMESAAKLLTETDLSISEISRNIGYQNHSKFTKAFKEYYNILPKDYRKK